MPQPKKRTRKQRVYNRAKTQDRIRNAREQAERLEIEVVLQRELEVRRLESIPAADRGETYDADLADARARLAADQQAAAATDASADKLGAPQSAAEKRERRDRVKAEQASRLGSLLDSWEAAMDGHERNLDRLEVVPEAQRADWRGSFEGIRDTAANEQGQQATWDAAWEYNERSLDQIERARTAAEAMLKERTA